MSLSFLARIQLLMVFLVQSTAVFAHAELQRAMPGVGATVSSPPSEIRLEFSERVELKFSHIVLSGSGGGIQTGNFLTLGADKTVLILKLGTLLKTGDYTVSWDVVSVDSHKTTGHFVFTVAP